MLKESVAVSSANPMPARSSEIALWKTILEKATFPQSGTRTHLSSGLVLMVGPKGGGKSALLKTFKLGNYETEESADADPIYHAILDYSYFAVTDYTGFAETLADREDAQMRVSVWSCSELEYVSILEEVIPPSKLDKLVVTVVVDLSRPWELISQLDTWVTMVDKLVSNLQSQSHLSSAAGSMLGNGRYEESAASKQGTVRLGSGVPLVVVACKSDLVKGETFDQQQRLHFVQQHLRRFCLRRGELPIFYVSPRNGSNCKKLQRYLLHLLYPDTFPFSDEALLGNEDIFIPSGWDSEALIDSILLEDWAKSSSFNDVIVPPPSNSSNERHQEEGNLESEQQWLLGLSKLVSSAPGPELLSHTATTTSSPSRMPKSLSDSKTAQSQAVETTDSKQLRSFFEGLLQKS